MQPGCSHTSELSFLNGQGKGGATREQNDPPKSEFKRLHPVAQAFEKLVLSLWFTHRRELLGLQQLQIQSARQGILEEARAEHLLLEDPSLTGTGHHVKASSELISLPTSGAHRFDCYLGILLLEAVRLLEALQCLGAQGLLL